ncbi:hypothetical protein [Streptomyces sp. NPDC046821]|uniref:hypothetical protein n=1 Tax=Streptomyces sp. NPDC046821 TaxID=3154702 RepID=UPI003407D769
MVWRLEVQDPSQLAGEDPDLDERTKQMMTELAGSLGCVYEHCVDTDTDTYADGTPYYVWWVRLPAAEHAWHDTVGIPQVLGPLCQYLTTQLPDGLKWEITPDGECTVDHAGSTALWTAYDDLIASFERALIPLRRDGADALDPRAKVWKWEANLLVGTFDLWLCNDPDRPHTWLVVTVGLWSGSWPTWAAASFPSSRSSVGSWASGRAASRCRSRPVWTRFRRIRGVVLRLCSKSGQAEETGSSPAPRLDVSRRSDDMRPGADGPALWGHAAGQYERPLPHAHESRGLRDLWLQEGLNS